MAGGFFIFSIVAVTLSSWMQTALHLESRMSRITCCCGRISLPLGAALSIGMTRMTWSPFCRRSETRRGSVPCPAFHARYMSAIFSLRAKIPSPVNALTETMPETVSLNSSGHTSFPAACLSPESSVRLSVAAGSCARRSILLPAMRQGIFLSAKRPKSSRSQSQSPLVASVTRMARSVCARICRVFLTRSSPSIPSSSNPGVSMITTGPRGKSSIAFLTGSVVVPST